jgi:hypothetical protein
VEVASGRCKPKSPVENDRASRHVGSNTDGNARWAIRQGMARQFGYALAIEFIPFAPLEGGGLWLEHLPTYMAGGLIYFALISLVKFAGLRG